MIAEMSVTLSGTDGDGKPARLVIKTTKKGAAEVWFSTENRAIYIDASDVIALGRMFEGVGAKKASAQLDDE
jgi:hypothetical protein